MNVPCSGEICIIAIGELGGLVDERLLHRVGRRAVRDDVLVDLGREEERLGSGHHDRSIPLRRPGLRPRLRCMFIRSPYGDADAVGRAERLAGARTACRPRRARASPHSSHSARRRQVTSARRGRSDRCSGRYPSSHGTTSPQKVRSSPAPPGRRCTRMRIEPCTTCTSRLAIASASTASLTVTMLAVSGGGDERRYTARRWKSSTQNGSGDDGTWNTTGRLQREAAEHAGRERVHEAVEVVGEGPRSRG